MSNKKSGFFPMLVGVVAGAAAVLFSDKKNREKASKAVAKGKVQLRRLSLEAKKDPEAFAKRMAKKVTKEAKNVSKKAKKLNAKIASNQKKA